MQISRRVKMLTPEINTICTNQLHIQLPLLRRMFVRMITTCTIELGVGVNVQRRNTELSTVPGCLRLPSTSKLRR